MPADVAYPIVVVGAGITGLYVADKLSASGYRVAVVDQFPIAAYSSTRNQGWLQSGAYYAVRGDSAAVDGCIQGFEAVVADCPEAVHGDTDAHLLFGTEAQRDGAVDRCAEAGIVATPITQSAYSRLVETNPMLDGSELLFAARIPDRPVDTHILLSRIASRARANGVHFRQVSCLHVVSVATSDVGWRISLGEGNTIETANLVLAPGPYLPHLLQATRPSYADKLRTTKVPVLVMRSSTALATSMLVTPYAQAGPNLVPFRSSAGQGLSLCLAGADRDCDPRGALDEDLPRGVLDAFSSQINRWYPGFAALATEHDIRCHIYMCQKLKLASAARGVQFETHRESMGTTQTRNLISIYPGKFTSAPVAAGQCLDQISTWIEADGSALAGDDPPPVARQRYYDPSQYRLADEAGFVTLESI
jgi:glycine/D-amino acid oxidase-like deaminating enzyme